jgi:hypothetical protein
VRAKAARVFSKWQTVLLVIANVLVLPRTGCLVETAPSHPNKATLWASLASVAFGDSAKMLKLAEDAHLKKHEHLRDR